MTMTSRIFAVLAAVSLVAAFALAALAPDGLNLGQGIALLDRDWLALAEPERGGFGLALGLGREAACSSARFGCCRRRSAWCSEVRR